MATPQDYIELRTRSAFSFLEGCSNPEDLVQAAADLDHPVLQAALPRERDFHERIDVLAEHRPRVVAPPPATRTARPGTERECSLLRENQRTNIKSKKY